MNEILLVRYGIAEVQNDVIGVSVDQEDKFIKFSAGGAIKQTLTDPLMTDNNKSIGQRNIEWLHQKLDEWINKQLENI